MGLTEHNPNPWQDVMDRRSLLALARAGKIREPDPHVRPSHGRWGCGAYRYVDDVEGGFTQAPQRYREWEYRLKYVDGCFFPFVQRRMPIQENKFE